jgi:hypothetical protein
LRVRERAVSDNRCPARSSRHSHFRTQKTPQKPPFSRSLSLKNSNLTFRSTTRDDFPPSPRIGNDGTNRQQDNHRVQQGNRPGGLKTVSGRIASRPAIRASLKANGPMSPVARHFLHESFTDEDLDTSGLNRGGNFHGGFPRCHASIQTFLL